MALATRCPHCRTTFRVAHDQLKLRAGLVRCGACKEIFNGIEHLLRPDQVPQPMAPPSSPPVAASAPSPAPPSAAVHAPHAQKASDHIPAVPAAPAEPVHAGGANHHPAIDPLQRMTLMDFTSVDEEAEGDDAAREPVPPPEATGPDPLEQAIESLRRKPLRSSRKKQDATEAADSIDDDEPSFVRQGRRRQRTGRALRIGMSVGSIVLAAGLLGQSVYLWRSELAARFPQVKPMLTDACSLLGCRVDLPAQIEQVSIESSDLQALNPEKTDFTLTVLLRNRSRTVQAWPHIELTLNDADAKPVARRVFTARDYLAPAPDPDSGFGPRSEQTIRLSFALSQLKASGYRVYLFYP